MLWAPAPHNRGSAQPDLIAPTPHRLLSGSRAGNGVAERTADAATKARPASAGSGLRTGRPTGPASVRSSRLAERGDGAVIDFLQRTRGESADSRQCEYPLTLSAVLRARTLAGAAIVRGAGCHMQALIRARPCARAVRCDTQTSHGTRPASPSPQAASSTPWLAQRPDFGRRWTSFAPGQVLLRVPPPRRPRWQPLQPSEGSLQTTSLPLLGLAPG